MSNSRRMPVTKYLCTYPRLLGEVEWYEGGVVGGEEGQLSLTYPNFMLTCQ